MYSGFMTHYLPPLPPESQGGVYASLRERQSRAAAEEEWILSDMYDMRLGTDLVPPGLFEDAPPDAPNRVYDGWSTYPLWAGPERLSSLVRLLRADAPGWVQVDGVGVFYLCDKRHVHPEEAPGHYRCARFLYSEVGIAAARCTRCELWLSSSAFGVRENGKPQSLCRECAAAVQTGEVADRRKARGPEERDAEFNRLRPAGKKCRYCRQVLPRDAFAVQARAADGRQAGCKFCTSDLATFKALGGRAAVLESFVERDMVNCQNCHAAFDEATPMHVDHFWPKAVGGPDELWNLQPLCAFCNLSKHDLLPSAWLAREGRL